MAGIEIASYPREPGYEARVERDVGWCRLWDHVGIMGIKLSLGFEVITYPAHTSSWCPKCGVNPLLHVIGTHTSATFSAEELYVVILYKALCLEYRQINTYFLGTWESATWPSPPT